MRVAFACCSRVALAYCTLALAACSHPPAAAPPVGGNAPVAGPADAIAPDPETRGSCQSGVVAGAPIEAPADQWTWVDFPDAKCRDGSPTGIGIWLHPGATQTMIYFEGGGACFHGASCAINDVLQSFDANAFSAWASTLGAGGIFDQTNAANPLRGWNMVYVPYCTGDVHAGDAEHVDVPGGPSDQMFVGFRNVSYYLQRLVPTFAASTHFLVTGISAGGFGAAFNYDRIAEAFCGARVTLIDDSGPPMSDDYLAPCLQKRWKELWNLDATLPQECTACRGADGGGIVHYVDYLTQKYPNERLGLISANMDSVISLFFGFGENDCAGLSGPSAPMAGSKFAAGLADLKEHYFSRPNLGSYIVPSTSHTWETGLTFYNTTVDTTALTTWMGQIVNEEEATHVGSP